MTLMMVTVEMMFRLQGRTGIMKKVRRCKHYCLVYLTCLRAVCCVAKDGALIEK